MFNSLMLEIAITRSQISKRDLAKKTRYIGTRAV